MAKGDILLYIRQLQRPIFTTSEIRAVSGKSLSTVVQSLNYLQKQGLILKIYRGIWLEDSNRHLSPNAIIPFLFPRQRAYLSFISALHLYGIIEQIPQVITIASISHSKIIRTKIGTFVVHQIAPWFFKGFDWYNKQGNFLIAEPEKALIDCLYLSAHKRRQFSYFPELHFPASFSFKKAKNWVKAIPNRRVKINLQRKLDIILKNEQS